MEDCNAMHFCWTISLLLYRQEIMVQPFGRGKHGRAVWKMCR